MVNHPFFASARRPPKAARPNHDNNNNNNNNFTSRLHSPSLSFSLLPIRLLQSLFLVVFDSLYSFIYFFVLTGVFYLVYDLNAEALLPSWLVVVAYSLLHTYYYYHCY